MCGIAGFLNRPMKWKDEIEKMNSRMHHRGPDACGYWSSDNHDVVLGHTRLSILDTSEDGNQPMLSHDGRYVIVFNGEIYNYKDLEKTLLTDKKVSYFQGHSDTEVLLEYISAYGFEEALNASIGMFAIGLYDRYERKFYLGRDRIGEKPLYYGYLEETFVFASEIGCIAELAENALEIDRDAMTLYFRHGYIPSPYTIYRGIKKLDAGSILELEHPYDKFAVHKYWDIMDVARDKMLHPFRGNEAEAAEELDRLLRRSVSMQMVADVPVGAFLSGGIDSTTIVSIMQSLSDKKIKTFSIGFEEKAYNEAPFAKNTAEYLGTDHVELYVKSQDVINIIPNLPYIYGEPFADSSQLPTYLVSNLAKQSVTVSLSGDAGDELFCGYGVYNSIYGIWKKIRHINMGIRKAGKCTLNTLNFGNEVLKQIAAYIDSDSIEDIYARTGEAHINLRELVRNGNPPPYGISNYPHGYLSQSSDVPMLFDKADKAMDGLNDVENLMLMDMLVYHPDDILVKVDRSAMAVSLESRVPLLDKEIVEFAFSLPHSYKSDGKIGKKVLRNVLYRYIPREMMDRPKQGFSIPVDKWIRNGQLTIWAEDLLDENKIRNEGMLDEKVVTCLWNDFKRTGRNGTKIWYLLMFEEWVKRNRQYVY